MGRSAHLTGECALLQKGRDPSGGATGAAWISFHNELSTPVVFILEGRSQVDY